MSTNRTKTDWAYYQAQRISLLVAGTITDQKLRNETNRKIAAILRRIEKRGQAQERKRFSIDVSRDVLTVAGIRKAKAALIAQEQKESTDTCQWCTAGNEPFHGYHYFPGDIAQRCANGQGSCCRNPK